MSRGAVRSCSLLRWPGWAHRPISNFKVSLPRGFVVSSCPLWEVGVGRMKTQGTVPKGVAVLFPAQPHTLGGCFGDGLVCLEDVGEFGHLGLGEQKTVWRRIGRAV